MACEMRLQWEHSNQLEKSGDSCRTPAQDRPVDFVYVVKLQLLTKDTHGVTALGCVFKFFLKIVPVKLTSASASVVCKSQG